MRYKRSLFGKTCVDPAVHEKKEQLQLGSKVRPMAATALCKYS